MPQVYPPPVRSGCLLPSESETSSPLMPEAWHRREIVHNLDSWIFKKLQPFIAQRVLEAGCGAGNLAQLMLDRDLVVGVDCSQEAVAAVRERFKGAPNFLAFECDVCDPSIRALEELRIDTVVSLNVIEHIEDDEKALGNLFAVLRPRGTFAVVVPAIPHLYGSMDKALGHIRRYTRCGIISKAERAGFKTEVCFYMNFVGVLGWFLDGKVLRYDLPPTYQLRLFNRMIPFLLKLETKLAPPVGLSIVYVGRRE